MAGAVVQPGAVVGDGCIVNTAAIVDHDCVLGAHCHVAPRRGPVRRRDPRRLCHIGAGAIILQGIALGANTLVGAGAVVVRNHPAASCLLGVPAQASARS